MTCKSRKYRKSNVCRSTFLNLKNNSKRRGIVFTLTFDEFEKFCYQTDYLKGKGRSSLSYSIDRIDNSKGYFIDNIQVLSVGENSRKGVKSLVYDYVEKTGYVRTLIDNKSKEEPDLF